MNVGIDKICMSVPKHYFSLTKLAEKHNVDAEKYLIGVGQNVMAVPSPDEDIVSMSSEAVERLLMDEDADAISTVIMATESSIDQAKCSGLFVHGLLDLNKNCRVIEFKQACYGATAALQMAKDMVSQRPEEKVLIIASDIARYEPGSSAECTQGAAAVAILVTANPRILALDSVTGMFSDDVMDYWRPNHHKVGQVNVQLTLESYKNSVRNAWKNYQEKGGHALEQLPWLCFHQPFTKMAKKGYETLVETEEKSQSIHGHKAYQDSLTYVKEIGNTYTASLYIGLISLLETKSENIAGQKVGLFSYGSGSVGEFFSGTVVEGYKNALQVNYHQNLLNDRIELSYEKYTSWVHHNLSDLEDVVFPKISQSKYRLNRISKYERIYGDSIEESMNVA